MEEIQCGGEDQFCFEEEEEYQDDGVYEKRRLDHEQQTNWRSVVTEAFNNEQALDDESNGVGRIATWIVYAVTTRSNR